MKIAQWFRFDELEKTIKRFPLPVFCCVAGLIVATFSILDIIESDWDFAGKTFVSLMLCFLWFSASKIYAEASDIKTPLFLCGSVVIGVFISIFVVWVNNTLALNFFTTFGSLLLLIGGAPYLFKKRDDLSFWSYNKIIWFGVSISFLAALLFYAGSSAVLASIDYLFGVDMPGDLYQIIGAFCFTILGPLYALSFAPYEYEIQEQECHLPPQLNFITNWILAPLVAVYLIILYAYYLKIGITWSIPKGELAYITSGFAVVGIVTYLVSWPARLSSGRILTFIIKYIFPVLILPTIMLLFAIWLRIDQYGFTEKRYIVLAFGVWFGFLAIGFTANKLQLKHIILSFAFLLFFSSWGPWGMRSVSLHSQQTRLEQLLIENDLLVSGEIRTLASEADVSFEARKNISSIVSYLFKYQWRRTDGKVTLYGYDSLAAFHEALGFEHIYKYEQDRIARELKEDKFSFTYQQENLHSFVPTKKYDFYLPNVNFWKTDDEKSFGPTNDRLFARLDENILSVQTEGGKTVRFDMGKIAQEQIEANPDRQPMKNELIVVEQSKALQVELTIKRLGGDITDGKPVVTSLSASALVKLR